jgi:23S rRNA (cytidine1920-2'-O)/16S rRNA (cytidine1409-2'-O)-methyltransferase
LLGKGGIVRDPSQICAVIIEVIDSAIEHHLTPLAIIPSVLPGESGNREFFLYARFAPNRPQRSLNRGEMRHAAQAATKWEPDSGLPPVIMVPPVSTNS